jgi:hypothetical protein
MSFKSQSRSVFIASLRAGAMAGPGTRDLCKDEVLRNLVRDRTTNTRAPFTKPDTGRFVRVCLHASNLRSYSAG